MTVLIVPELEGDVCRWRDEGGRAREEPWATLGPAVVEWIEDHVVHGPGPLLGEPYRMDQEFRGLVYRMYQLFPPGHPRAGRRRFSRVAVSMRKGSAKTEWAAAIVAAELHRDAPVRFAGWYRSRGVLVPEGRPVRSPYIPLMAYTEQQTEDLAYGALMEMLGRSPIARDFDIGLERILRSGGDGEAKALAQSPSARDGARTTFQHFDETHRFDMARQKRAFRTMIANTAKLADSDPWSLETTTAYEPGTASVAEDTHEYARQVASGKIQESRLFFFHREAGEEHDVSTPEGLRAAIVDASGPAKAAWTDIDAVAGLWQDPEQDHAYLERVWLNRTKARSSAAFDVEKFKGLELSQYSIPAGALVTLGFDGARYHDDTGLVATEVATGHQEVLGHWHNELGVKGWEVPADEVDAAVDEAFRRFEVWRMYADPYYWESYLADWQGRHGDKKVVEFRTTRLKLMADALVAYKHAIDEGDLTHDGTPALAEHVGHARKRDTNFRDERGEKLWTIQKERDDSPFKIDLAMAGTLSYQARLDAVAAGAKPAGSALPNIWIPE